MRDEDEAAAEQVGRLLDQTFAAVPDGISLSIRGPAVPFDEIGRILGSASSWTALSTGVLPGGPPTAREGRLSLSVPPGSPHPATLRPPQQARGQVPHHLASAVPLIAL
ncbi:hypothetical protein [Streptosporangium canum]|uniref:hypothetical protein n=1 Tax=Streptosporangium canum TaxID=324952 RepID=UPI00378956E7